MPDKPMWKNWLKDRLFCAMAEEKELAPLLTLGVGGRCEVFTEPSSLDDVSLIFEARKMEDFPLYILGGGSNVVFADGFLPGMVLSSRRLAGFKWDVSGGHVTLEVEAGYHLADVVSETVRNGLTGAEFAVGIPGTFGGAMTGNAGAGGYSMGDLLEEVTTVESGGEIRTWKRGEFDYSYRRCSLALNNCFLAGGKMSFRRASPDEIELTLGSFRRMRQSQPKGASAGSTFKNPRGDSAGRLLEESGCKGLRVGGAVVSDVHANFIFNAGGASGADVFRLMRSCRDIVLHKFGITLEPEIKFLGFNV